MWIHKHTQANLTNHFQIHVYGKSGSKQNTEYISTIENKRMYTTSEFQQGLLINVLKIHIQWYVVFFKKNKPIYTKKPHESLIFLVFPIALR